METQKAQVEEKEEKKPSTLIRSIEKIQTIRTREELSTSDGGGTGVSDNDDK